MYEFAFRLGMVAESLDNAQGEESGSMTGSMGDGAQTLMFALGLLLMISLLTRTMLRAYQRSRRKSPKKDVKRVRAAADKKLAHRDTPLIDAPGNYTRWHSEMNDIARSVEAEVETKLRRLQATIRLADETAARLERAIREARHLNDAKHPSDSLSPQASDAEEVLESVRELTESTQKTSRLNHAGKLTEIEQRVLELARENATAREIAQSLGTPLGDVELIISTQGGIGDGKESPDLK